MKTGSHRHHCSKSGIIPRTGGWPDSPQLNDSLIISMKFDCHKTGLYWSKSIFQEPDLAYPRHSFKTCGGPAALTSAMIFMRCGGKKRPGGQERYILKTH